MITYGLRGLCAYTHHAEVLGQRDADVDRFVAECYAFLCSPDALDLGKTLAMVDACGAAGLKAMKALDEGALCAAVGCDALPQCMHRVWGAGRGCACAAAGVPAGLGSGASALERWAPPACLPAVHSLLPPTDRRRCLPAAWTPPCRPHLQVWAPGAHAGAHHAGFGRS